MDTTITSSLLSMHNGTLCMACNYDGADHFSISHGCRRKMIVVGNLLKSLHHLQIVKSDWLNIMLLRHYTTHNFIEWPTTRSEDEHCAFHPISNEIKPKKKTWSKFCKSWPTCLDCVSVHHFFCSLRPYSSGLSCVHSLPIVVRFCGLSDFLHRHSYAFAGTTIGISRARQTHFDGTMWCQVLWEYAPFFLFFFQI